MIGIDSSTTATKAVAWDRDGRALAEGRAEFELQQPAPGYHEQDAEDWWRSTVAALRDAVRQVDPSEVEAIGITHQRETFVCLGDGDEPLRPAILWMDARASEQVDKHGSEDVHRISGKPPDTTPAFYKLLWLADHEPEVLERTRRVVDVHAYPGAPADRAVEDDVVVRGPAWGWSTWRRGPGRSRCWTPSAWTPASCPSSTHRER